MRAKKKCGKEISPALVDFALLVMISLQTADSPTRNAEENKKKTTEEANEEWEPVG